MSYQPLPPAAIHAMLTAIDKAARVTDKYEYGLPTGSQADMGRMAVAASSALREWFEAQPKKVEPMTSVPILAEFGTESVIGELRVLTSALPPIPNFVFSLGIKVLEYSGTYPGEIPTAPYAGRYQLIAVAPVSDRNYLGYLQQIGVAAQHTQEGGT